ALYRSRIPHAFGLPTHWHRRLLAGRAGFALRRAETFADFRKDCRAVAVGLVESAGDSPLCQSRGDRAAAAHLAGHWHARRAAHCAASREISRRAARKRLEARARLALRARGGCGAQRSSLGTARAAVLGIFISRARGRCIIRALVTWFPGGVACRRAGLSPFCASAPLKRARNSFAPARLWVASSFFSPLKSSATPIGCSNV